MAEVWKAKIQGAAGFAKTVAIKRVLMEHSAESTLFDQLFIQEAKLAAELSHPNIVAVHDFGQTESGEYFIAMEYVSGRNLSVILHRMEERGVKMSLEWALYITAEACRGLGYAHTMTDEFGKPLHLVHRDVSPQNILVSWHGDVKLTDFGIAKAASSLTATDGNRVMGKIAYMSPEHARGEKLDHRSDLFGLGLVLFEQLAGDKLFRGSAPELYGQVLLHAGLRPDQLARVPEASHAVLKKALAADREHRFRDASEMEAALLAPLSPGALVDVRRIMSTVIRNYFAPEIEVEATGDQAAAAAQMPSDATLAPKVEPVATELPLPRMPIATPVPSFAAPFEPVPPPVAAEMPSADPVFGAALPEANVTPIPDAPHPSLGLGASAPLPWASAAPIVADPFFGVSRPALTAPIPPPPPPLSDEPLVVGVPRFRPAAERWKQIQRVMSLAVATKAPFAVSADGEVVRLWDIAKRREVTGMKGHRNAVTCVAITEDGSIAASTSRDGNLRIWEVSAGRTLHVLDHNPGALNCVSLSSDGWLAVSGGADGRVGLWDLVTMASKPKLTAHGSFAVTAVALIDEGRALSGAEDGTLIVWDIVDRKAMTRGSVEGGVRAITTSPDGRHALVGTASGALLLFELDPFRQAAELRHTGSAQTAVAFAPEGGRAASGDAEGLVHLWETRSATALSTFELHDAGVTGLAFVEGGEKLVSCSEDRTLALWVP